MKRWSFFFLIIVGILILAYFVFNLLVMLGVLSILLFVVLIVWDATDGMKWCEVPYCGRWGFLDVKIGPKGVLILCHRHFKRFTKAYEYARKGTSRPFFTEERKRRMFNPTAEEKENMDYLVGNEVLERTLIGGKPSYKPSEKFFNKVIEAKINLLLKGYVLDLRGQTEEGTRIAIKQSITKADAEEVEKYSEMACPFVYWEEMDRELNPNRRRTHATSSKRTYIV